jgi:hypothetical protein
MKTSTLSAGGEGDTDGPGQQDVGPGAPDPRGVQKSGAHLAQAQQGKKRQERQSSEIWSPSGASSIKFGRRYCAIVTKDTKYESNM